MSNGELEKEEAEAVKKAQKHKPAMDVVLEGMSEDEERVLEMSSKDVSEEEEVVVAKEKKRPTGPKIAKDIPDMKVTKHEDPTLRKAHQGPILAKDTI